MRALVSDLPGRGRWVTGTWLDRRGDLVLRAGRVLTGVGDRSASTAAGIEQTLAGLTERAEGPPPA